MRAANPWRQPGVPHGHGLTDRDQVDDVPARASTSAVTIVRLPMNADSRPPVYRRVSPMRAAIQWRQPGVRYGHGLTDRDQVDDVPARASRSAATLCLVCLFQKTRIPSSRRQQPSYQGPEASCRSPASHPVRDRASRWQPSSTAGYQKPRVRQRSAATAGRGSAESCRRPEILGRATAAGEGTASAFFAGEDTGLTGRKPVQAQIHLIAIRKSRLPDAIEACSSDGQASIGIIQSTRSARIYAARERGSTAVKVVPDSAPDDASSDPPCDRAISAAMYSPSPSPARGRLPPART
jgi:hypothetical protein